MQAQRQLPPVQPLPDGSLPLPAWWVWLLRSPWRNDKRQALNQALNNFSIGLLEQVEPYISSIIPSIDAISMRFVYAIRDRIRREGGQDITTYPLPSAPIGNPLTLQQDGYMTLRDYVNQGARASMGFPTEPGGQQRWPGPVEPWQATMAPPSHRTWPTPTGSLAGYNTVGDASNPSGVFESAAGADDSDFWSDDDFGSGWSDTPTDPSGGSSSSGSSSSGSSSKSGSWTDPNAWMGWINQATKTATNIANAVNQQNQAATATKSWLDNAGYPQPKTAPATGVPTTAKPTSTGLPTWAKVGLGLLGTAAVGGAVYWALT